MLTNEEINRLTAKGTNRQILLTILEEISTIEMMLRDIGKAVIEPIE